MTTAPDLDPNSDLDNHDGWLPDWCPSWCDTNHAAARAEGCGWTSSQTHLRTGGGDCLSEIHYAGRPVRDYGAGYDLCVEQQPMRDGGLRGPALVQVSVHDAEHCNLVILPLTTGEARTLAAQLVALADAVDLPDHR